MSTKSRFLALTAMFSILTAATLQAGVLTSPTGAYDDGVTVWAGSTPYSNGGLFGTIDYKVMTAADFVTEFPTSTYTPGNTMVYLYQVNNDGTHSVSAEIVGISNPADTIGQFVNAPGEVAPDQMGFGGSGTAFWNFLPFVLMGESSSILTFSSPNVPMFGASITVNAGTIAVSQVPTPSATPIPEPTGLVLVAAGLLAFVGRYRRV